MLSTWQKSLSTMFPRTIVASWRKASSTATKARSVSTDAKKSYRSDKVANLSSSSVWTEFTPLANKYGAVNLGQGFPDFAPDEWILEATNDALKRGLVQYARSPGHLRLVNALAKVYGPLMGRELNSMTEILTTVGATEAIFICMQAFLSAGDECILIEPSYDSYAPSVVMAGGKPVSIPLRLKGSKSTSSADWVLDRSELISKITPRTKMILINNPMNVPGKVWSRDDLMFISKLAQEHDFLVVSDEVYEWITYDGKEHLKIATLPGMWDRTLTLGSAGKSFSLTGYKVGWIVGPHPLVDALSCAHQNSVFSVATPMQEGIAIALEQSVERKYFTALREMFAKKRDALCSVLGDVGLTPTVPEGSYFVLADTSKVKDGLFMDPQDLASRDFQFCRWLVREIGVAAIPPSAFFSAPNKALAANFARFAFCKQDKSFSAAHERLKKLNLK